MEKLKNQFRQVKAINVPDNQLGYGGGCMIFGATLWTDFQLNNDLAYDMEQAKWAMNDFNLIRYKNHILTPQDVVDLHQESIRCLRIFSEINYPTKVIVTHHLPSKLSIHPDYEESHINPAFASNLDELVEQSGAKLWIHGHTHESCDYMIGSTRVICNPRGYPPFNPNFNPNLVVEI